MVTMLVSHANAAWKVDGSSSRTLKGFSLMLQKWFILRVLALIWLMIVLSFSVPASQIYLNLI